MKSNKSISQEKKFAISKMAKINFSTGEKSKTAKNAISQKVFDFTSFFASTFLNFLAHCGTR